MMDKLSAIVRCRETQSKSYCTFIDVERWFLAQNWSNLAFTLGSVNFRMSKVEMWSNSSQTRTRGFTWLMDNLSTLEVNSIENLINEYPISTLLIDWNLTLFISLKSDVHDSKNCPSTLKSSFFEHFFVINPLARQHLSNKPLKESSFYILLSSTNKISLKPPENSTLGRFYTDYSHSCENCVFCTRGART